MSLAVTRFAAPPPDKQHSRRRIAHHTQVAKAHLAQRLGTHRETYADVFDRSRATLGLIAREVLRDRPALPVYATCRDLEHMRLIGLATHPDVLERMTSAALRIGMRGTSGQLPVIDCKLADALAILVLAKSKVRFLTTTPTSERPAPPEALASISDHPFAVFLPRNISLSADLINRAAVELELRERALWVPQLARAVDGEGPAVVVDRPRKYELAEQVLRLGNNPFGAAHAVDLAREIVEDQLDVTLCDSELERLLQHHLLQETQRITEGLVTQLSPT